jgi:hypothetical protein
MIGSKLTLADLRQAARERTLKITAAPDGVAVSPDLAEHHRKPTEAPKPWKSRTLTDGQRAIVERVVAGCDIIEPLTVLKAAADDIHMGAWPVHSVIRAFEIAGFKQHAHAVRSRVGGLRISRFGDAAAVSLEIVRQKKRELSR